MAEEQKGSALSDPRFWLSVLGFLWVLTSAVTTSIWSKLNSIDSTVQASSVQSAAEGQKRVEMERRLSSLETRVATDERDQNAYNYDQGKMMTKIQTQIGMNKDGK